MKSAIINAENINKARDFSVAVGRFFLENVRESITSLVTIKGNYNAGTQYVNFDVVSYKGMTYMALYDKGTIPIGTPPTNTAYFSPITMNGTTYIPNVSSDGWLSWQKDSSGNAPDVSTTYIKGNDGTGMSPKGIWSSEKTYSKDDLVSYENSWYQSLQNENLNKNPKISPEFWLCILTNETLGSIIIADRAQPEDQAVGGWWYQITG